MGVSCLLKPKTSAKVSVILHLEMARSIPVLLAVIFIIFMIQTVFIEVCSIENRTFGNSSLSGLTSAFNTSKFSCNNHTDCEGIFLLLLIVNHSRFFFQYINHRMDCIENIKKIIYNKYILTPPRGISLSM